MANNEFYIGTLVRASVSYTDSDGAAADPTVPKVTYVSPSGTVTTLTYPGDAAYVKDGTGEYHCDIDADEAGTWYVRGWSTGSGQTATEADFVIKTPLSDQWPE